MATIYTVSQLNNEIKDLLDAVPGYRGLMVQGEISNYKAHSSGHHYMTLKDENAAINAVMFRSDAMRLKFRLQNGMKVIVKARVSSFPRTGAVAALCVVKSFRTVQVRSTLRLSSSRLNCRRKACSPERYKKPHSVLSGQYRARDLADRRGGARHDPHSRQALASWPRLCSIPAQVQGQGAAESIARAIALANAIGEADVILCGRGGGSMEDLWAFNEEVTARAICASELPVISAVGHEPDFTIADFVADLRAPTPSGAAELAVPDRAEYALNLRTLDARLHTAARRRAEQQRKLLDGLQERLSNRTPMKYIEEKRLLLTQTEERLFSAVPVRLETERNRLNGLQQRLLAAGQSGLHRRKLRFAQTVATLDAMSPLRVLGRG